MKNYKLYFSLILSFLFLVSVLAQNDEANQKKALLLEQKEQTLTDNYNYLSTIYVIKDIGSWKNTNWETGKNNDLLFSTGSYLNNKIYKIESEPIFLPELSDPNEKLSLIIEESFELESFYDKGSIKISDNGGKSWNTVSIRSGVCKNRQLRINLTSYAGKKVLLAFELVADESYAYSGWNLFNITINKEYLAVKSTSSLNPFISKSFSKGASGLQGNLLSIDAQKFPRFIFSNFSITNNGAPLGTLDESNINIVETIKDTIKGDTVIDVVKDATFKLYAPEIDTNSRLVDVVFLMDNSGSMGDEQAAVAANVASFVHDLDTSGFNYRLALCRFGQSASGGVPILYNNAAWYSDPATFLNVWNNNTVDGYKEPSWDALIESARGYPFANTSQKIFMLITDETITNNNIVYSVCQDRQEVIDILQAAGVTLYTLVPNTSVFQSDFGDIADSTGGMSFLITDPFNEILDSIGKQISSAYTVRYTPTWPQFDGYERDVEFIIDYNADTLNLYGSYIPGASPIIQRTDETVALETKKVIQNESIDIEAYIYDFYMPYTQSATLFYKCLGSSADYTSISMTKKLSSDGDTIWSAHIPESDVLAPGIKYYIKATDGQSTTIAPEFIDLEGYPYSFAVYPNVAPVIYDLTEQDSLNVGDTICFRAYASDQTDSVYAVYLYVRTMNDIVFSNYAMVRDTGDTYIYCNFILPEGITEYFLVAEDNFGVSTFFGDENSPLTITPESSFEISPTPYKHTINLAGLDISSFPFKIWSADLIYNGNTLVYGDKVGVFYTDTVCNSMGDCTYEQKCAGIYNYTGNITLGSQILVYGDNPQTVGVKEGFAEGEEFIFKIFKAADSSSHMAEFKFRLPLKDTVFTIGGSSDIDSIYNITKQSTVLEIGLNLWSTTMVPEDCTFKSIFANQPNVNQVADDQGNIWMPNQTANTLTDYVPGYGYEVYMDSSSVLDVFGSQIDISKLSISLVGNQQSTLIGCPYSSPENVESVFSNYTSNIYAVDKYINDGAGLITIETYSPMFALNNWSDKNMVAGQGYYTFAIYPMTTFTYPPATGKYKSTKSVSEGITISQQVHSPKSYMHLFVPGNVWDEKIEFGSELRVYNSGNELIGRNIIRVEGTQLVIDGYNLSEGDLFTLRLWTPSSDNEINIDVVKWQTGSNEYQNLKSAVVGQLKTDLENPVSIYPNPTGGNLHVLLSFKQEKNVKISVQDIAGKTVLKFSDVKSSAENQEIDLDVSSLTDGKYILLFDFDGEIVTKPFVKKE